MTDKQLISADGNINISSFRKEVELLSRYVHAAETALALLDNDADINTINPSTLFSLCSILNAQRKAPIIEKFVCARLSLDKVSASKNRGDACDKKSDATYEFKISTTNHAQCLNIRQVRLWQSIDYYLVAYINELDVSSSYVFLLTHQEMSDEIEKHGCATHGTSSANKQNKNIEYSMTLKIGSQLFSEWLAKYHSDTIKLMLFSDETESETDGEQK